MNMREAIAATPGPRSVRDAVLLFLKGVCMGGADIIPGVSGGTIAFITGIYWELIAAIKSFNARFIGALLRFRFIEAVSIAHFRFLIPLLFGILLAVVSMARVMHHLLHNHPVEIWSLFFGLIAASIIVVGKGMEKLDARTIPALILGAAAGFLLVGLIPVTTPETLPFLFFCGMLAICAMILPGISGAFILLLLGKYEMITGALKNPFLGGNMLLIAVFAAGCLLGITLFSRVLHYFLSKFPRESLAVLTGFLAGSLRKIWPWKETLEVQVIRGKEYVLREANILPERLDSSLALALGLMVLGVVLVLLLDRVSGGAKDVEQQQEQTAGAEEPGLGR